jgi:hypothetical protein
MLILKLVLLLLLLLQIAANLILLLLYGSSEVGELKSNDSRDLKIEEKYCYWKNHSFINFHFQ